MWLSSIRGAEQTQSKIFNKVSIFSSMLALVLIILSRLFFFFLISRSQYISRNIINQLKQNATHFEYIHFGIFGA